MPQMTPGDASPAPQQGGGGGGTLSAATIEAAARSFGVSPNDIRRALEAGQITPAQVKSAAGESPNAPPGDTPDSPGGGGSSSSGGGSSGGGGSAAPDPKDVNNAVESYVSTLSAWGIPVTGAVRAWLRQRIVRGDNSQAIMNAFRKTKAYAKAFPGLMRRDGTLRMSESQYLSGYQSVKDYASSVGRGLSKAQFGRALKMGNSPAEMKTKVEALDILRTNRAIMSEFSEYLQTTGVTKKPLSKKELFQFVMKQGPKEWEQQWETANQGAVLEKFGVSVGRGDDVSYKELTKLRAQMLPGQEVDYGALAQMAEKLGAARLYGLGVTKKDLVDMAYGTKRAPKIAERVKLALGTAEAFATEQRANPMLTQQGLGGGQGRPQQATE